MPIGKCLVLDASVICAAGPLNLSLRDTDPTPILCQQALGVIQELQYRIVRTPAIVTEWERCLPTSGRVRGLKFAATWLTFITSRSRFCTPDVPLDEKLRNSIEQLNVNDDIRKILREDVHLIEAALQTERIVISRDVQARHHFHEAASTIQELRKVVWIDPCNAQDDCLPWLKSGAKLEAHRRLGFGL